MRTFCDKKKLAMPDLVLFDLDNTLYEYETPHLKAYAAVAAKFEGELGLKKSTFHQLYNDANSYFKKQLEGTAASHSKLLYFVKIMEKAGLQSQPMLALDFEQTYWRTFMSSANLCSGVMEFIDELRIAGIPRALITDLTTQIQYRKLIYFELDQSFDQILNVSK